MEPTAVLTEFKHLISNGYKEIILTGVNVGDYGKTFDARLYDLLCRMIEVDGNFRIRISSIEPNLLSDDILQLTHQSEKMCKHFHIPLQSGNPKILKLMQRRYKAEYYSEVIHKANELISNVGIGIDVIVGFPGETEEDFLTTYNFIKELPVSYLHVFTYSERPDTKAVSMGNRIEVIERKRRNNMLRILSDKKKNLFYESMIGRELEVLFESENDNGKIKGFSSNYVRVSNDYDSSLINELSTIRIEGVRDNLCHGTILGNKKSIDLIAC
jgi:threonylcarbamoyladenosine tRNA methylthiotransferase MtaB